MSLLKSIKDNTKRADNFNKFNKNKPKSGMNDKDKKLLGIFNRMFYCEKNAEEETKFVRQMITRGLETQERSGLHASSIIKDDEEYCVREQVLSLMYKMIQRDNIDVGLMRIFEEGNAIHEKWQRLLIRAGYGKATDMDLTQFDERYNLSYTPDIICEVPEFIEGKMVGEIKSVNTFVYKTMESHESAEKQIQLYMYLTGIHQGFILLEDKNNQDFKIHFRTFDKTKVQKYIDRLEEVNRRLAKAKKGKMVKRFYKCTDSKCERASKCAMRDACFNVGIGRVKLGE